MHLKMKTFLAFKKVIFFSFICYYCYVYAVPFELRHGAVHTWRLRYMPQQQGTNIKKKYFYIQHSRATRAWYFLISGKIILRVWALYNVFISFPSSCDGGSVNMRMLSAKSILEFVALCMVLLFIIAFSSSMVPCLGKPLHYQSSYLWFLFILLSCHLTWYRKTSLICWTSADL